MTRTKKKPEPVPAKGLEPERRMTKCGDIGELRRLLGLHPDPLAVAAELVATYRALVYAEERGRRARKFDNEREVAVWSNDRDACLAEIERLEILIGRW